MKTFIAVLIALTSISVYGEPFLIHGTNWTCDDIKKIDDRTLDSTGWSDADFNTAIEWIKDCTSFFDRPGAEQLRIDRIEDTKKDARRNAKLEEIGKIEQEAKEKRQQEEKRLADERAAKRAADDALEQESMRKQQEEIDHQEKLAAQAEEKLKKQCGKDYHQFHIGMSRARLVQCVTNNLMAQRADGIEIFATHDLFISIKNGKVYSWTRR